MGKTGKNFGQVLAEHGFVQDYTLSRGNSTAYTKGNTTVRVNPSGFAVVSKETIDAGGATPEQLEQLLAWLSGKAANTTKPLTITEVAVLALHIRQEYAMGAQFDAGFDAGEFSGPASDRAAERAVMALAPRFGYTLDELDREMIRLEHQYDGVTPSDKQLRVVFTHEVDIEPAITPQQLLDMVLDGSYTWSDMGEVEIQNHLGQVLARETNTPGRN